MRNITHLFLLIILVGCSIAEWPNDKYISKYNYQEVIGQIDIEDPNKPDKYAMYPNGSTGINDLIVKNISYPEEAREKEISGQVILKYVVEKDGYVKQIEVLQSVHPILDEESIRVLKLMSRWIPGMKNGKPIRIQYRQPFNFKIQ